MIDIVVDLTAFKGTMGNLERQLPYAASRALNDVALGFQQDERAGIQQRFTVRRPWVLQGVKINRGDFATKQKLSVTVRIDENRSFFDKFEQGETIHSTRSLGQAKNVGLGLPVTVRRTKTQIISKTQFPTAFQFTKGFTSRKSRWSIYQGDKRTFILQRPDGFGLILQRTGRALLGPLRHGTRGAGNKRQWGHDPYLRVLWALRPSAKMPATLEFGTTAGNSFRARWVDAFKRRWAEAIASAKP